MASKVTAVSANLPSRRRRDSSEDFTGESLGSVAGSAFGTTNVDKTSNTSNASASASTAKKPIDTLEIASASASASTAKKPIDTLEIASASASTAKKPIDTLEIASASASTAKKPIDTLEIASASASTAKKPIDTLEIASASVSTAKRPIDTLEIASITSTRGTGSALSPSGRRPFRKRAGTMDFSLNLDNDSTLNLSNSTLNLSSSTLNLSNNDDNSRILPAVDALPPMDSSLPLENMESDITIIRGGRSHSSSLDQLDALGNEAGEAAANIRDVHDRTPRAGSFSARSKEESDNSSSHGTMTSQSHRFLLEAFMGDAEESLMLDHRRERLESFDVRERLGSFDFRDRLGSLDVRERLGSTDVRDRLSSFDVRERLGSMDMRDLTESLERGRSGSLNFRRERLESWGGMSELSAPFQGDSGNESGSNAAAIAARLYTSLANDLSAAANLDGNESVSSFLVNDEVIPTRISVTRSRLNSIASESSALEVQIPSETDLGSDLHKFVTAAMASVGDQLAVVAAAENPTADHESVASSTISISPMIGAASDAKAAPVATRSRSNSTSSALNISVDYDAVAAAVDAAQAAAHAIDLATFTNMVPPATSVSGFNKKRKAPRLPMQTSSIDSQSSSSKTKPKPAGPLHINLPPIPQSKMDDKDMEILRERARAAAGYIPPTTPGTTPIPPKKKTKLDSPYPQTPAFKTTELHQTPRTCNTAYKSMTPGTPFTPAMSTPGSAKSTVSKGQSSQKWDSMFECLVLFINDRKTEENIDLCEEECTDWLWDGNVPTTFKSKDNKALGRWVNNQRSAKSKGVLKDDREKRLVDAGLKWSVLASNSWNEMLEELRIYVAEQVRF
jgi:hypothetical protein